MVKDKYTKFEYGTTPTYFFGTLDCFIQAATWYDSVDVWDKEVLATKTLFENMGLDRKYRTNDLKLHVFNLASKSMGGDWRDVNIGFVMFHLLCQPASRLHIVDGYPSICFNVVERYIKAYCATTYGFTEKKFNTWFADHVYITKVKNEREFLRERGNLEVLANEHNVWFQSLILLDEDNLSPSFLAYEKRLVIKMNEQNASKYPPRQGMRSAVSGGELSPEDLAKLFKDFPMNNNDDDGNGDLQ